MPMDTLRQDLRYAVRALRLRPGFTTIVALTLAIGIGANTAMFTVAHATLLRSLPFLEPERLVDVSLIVPARADEPRRDDMVWSYPKFETFRDAQHAFSRVALYADQAVTLSGIDVPERLQGETVGADYFAVLGVRAAHGRLFLPEEDTGPGTRQVVVLGWELWRRVFGGDPGVLGSRIMLDGQPFTVVGVAPSSFRGLGGTAELFTPIMARPASMLAERWAHEYRLVGRLAPGVSFERALAEVRVLGARVEAAHPAPVFREGDARAAWGATARPLGAIRTDPLVARSVVVLSGAVAFVLLIACVNVAQLQLARASARWRETSVRLALGAGRTRLLRQWLTESLLLAALGGALGVLLAWWGVRVLGALAAEEAAALASTLPGLTRLGLSTIRLDGAALLFTLAATVLTGLLFGLAPALHAVRSGIADALRAGTSTAPTRTRPPLLSGRSVLVVVQVAVALVLLTGAGLMTRSLARLLAEDAGFDGRGVLTFRIALPPAAYDRAAAARFYEELLPRLGALPGVRASAMGNCAPLSGRCNATVGWLPERSADPPPDAPMVGIHFVSPGWLRAMGVPLLAGRAIGDADRVDAPKVVLVNRAAARAFWPDGNAVGRRFAAGQGGMHTGAEVVGVIGDTRFESLDKAPMPAVYVSSLQSPRQNMTLFVKADGAPLALTAAIRRELRAIDPTLPIFDVRTLDERAGRSSARQRISALLLGTFATVALLLAATGLYGVLSYMVTERTREIGIRVALGAARGRIVSLVARQGLVVVGIGLSAGLVLSAMASRVLDALLYGVAPGDPVTFAAVSALLAMVGVAASLVPALRATRVSPLEALRSS
jgi:putative ABC transport system permease protein